MELTQAQIKSYVGTVPSFYESMVRNGWYLPPKKSTCITYDYLLLVHKRKVYCPKYSEIRLRPCFAPMRKKLIFKAISSILQKQQLQLGILEGKLPAVSWLTNLLSTLNPDHKMFTKSFLPDLVKHSKANTVKVDQDFFLGLPQQGMNKRCSKHMHKMINQEVIKSKRKVPK